jgi:hypothetical protein
MSIRITSMVWDLELGRDEKLILLAYADCADHDGGSIFPAISTVAKKTGYSQRSVQRHTRSLEKKGYLISEGYGAGRSKTNRWHIPIQDGAIRCPSARINADTTMPPLETERVTSVQEKVTSVQERMTSVPEKVPSMAGKGDRVVSPESSVTVIEPSINARELSPKEVEEITRKEKARELAELERAQSPKAWCGRETLPEPIRDLLDVYVQITGQRPSKGQLMDWLASGQEWLEIGLTAADLRAAYSRSKSPEGRGFLVTRPGSLTSTAGAIAGERRRKGESGQSLVDRVRAFLEK